MAIHRRDFLKKSVAGLAAVVLGSTTLPKVFGGSQAQASLTGSLEMDMVDAYHEMVDGQLIYSWAFSIGGQPSLPGPVIFVKEGDSVTLIIRNSLDEPHSFGIQGNDRIPFVVRSPVIPPGEVHTLTFTAPAPGTYIYEDLENAPVGRVLGLHGVLVVMPQADFVEHDTPYGRLGSSHPVQMLFDDLGSKPWFPGDCWRPERQIIWVFSETDPRYNKMAEEGQNISSQDMLKNFMPCYFFINGRSGYFAAFDDHHHYHESGKMPKPIPPLDGYIPAQELDTCIMAYQGEPILVRNVHVGLDTHSPHTHANHSYSVALNGIIQGDRLDGGCWWVDTWSMLPGDRMDVIYPMIQPPDIPAEIWRKLMDGTSEEGFGPGEESHWNVAHPGPGFPMAYPMHSHQEISQTAAGGNYPQGLITHIEFLGDFTKRPSQK